MTDISEEKIQANALIKAVKDNRSKEGKEAWVEWITEAVSSKYSDEVILKAFEKMCEDYEEKKKIEGLFAKELLRINHIIFNNDIKLVGDGLMGIRLVQGQKCSYEAALELSELIGNLSFEEEKEVRERWVI